MRFLLCLLFLFSVPAFACSSKHHIFLLHGIGGGSGTFGSLEKILNQQNPCNTAQTFVYDTGSIKTPYEFSKDFHQFVNNREIRSNDKVSLIMHSQGGLVGTLWLRYLLEIKSPLIPVLDSFITLSTPYWGTDIAHVGKVIFHTGISNPVSPFGKNELNEMSYGSRTVLDFARDLDRVYESIPNLRTLTVAGMKRLYNSTFGEDDVVVPMHSMRPGRFYYKDNVSVFDKPREILTDNFHKSPERPFEIVSADHIRLLNVGVAEIPSSCLNVSQCKHPSLPLILSQLERKSSRAAMKYELTRFRVSLYLDSENFADFDEKEFGIEVKVLDKHTRIPSIERFNPFLGKASLKKGLAFSFGGVTKKMSSTKVQVRLLYKNKLLKTYHAPVEAGTSTFIDATLLSER